MKLTLPKSRTEWLMCILVGVIAIFCLLISGHLSIGEEDASETYIKTEAHINTLKAVLTAFNKQTGTWPTTKEGLLVLTLPAPDPKNTGNSVCILKPSVLVDPWGSDFHYAYPAQRSKGAFDLWSMGPDKRSGTEDDIGNWPASAAAK